MADNTQIPSAIVSSENWKFQESYVERLMDHSALSAAHPDDTLVLAGPPRYLLDANSNSDGGNIIKTMLPIGMVQQIQINQSRPTTPAMAVGSGRMFYLSGKAQGGMSIARLFMNGRNLLRALMHNAVTSGIDASKFDDIGAAGKNSHFFANLDSELFLIPFGMAILFRDKVHNELGGVFAELCMINSWNVGVGAGQTMIMENANIVFDRLLPITFSAGMKSTRGGETDNYNPDAPASSNLLKAIYGDTAAAGWVESPDASGDRVEIGETP